MAYKPEYLERKLKNDFTAWLLALAIGCLGTYQFHAPQFSSWLGLVPGNRGDARLVVYLLEHWYQVLCGKGALLSPAMFYPIKGTLGYADVFLGFALPYALLRAIGLDTLLAYEIVLIFFNFLNYLACFVLLYKVLRLNVIAATAGALFFAFNSPKLIQLGHPQLQPMFLLPLAVGLIILLVQRAEKLTQIKAFALLTLAGIVLHLQLLTGFYIGWFFVFWCFLFLALSLLIRRSRVFIFLLVKRFWLAVMGSAIVLLFASIPFLMVYVPVIRIVGWRPYEAIVDLVPDGWAYLSMGGNNYLWGFAAPYIAAATSSPHRSAELQIGFGLIASAAWLATCVYGVRTIIKFAKPSAGKNLTAQSSDPSDIARLFTGVLILATAVFFLLGTRYWHDFSPWQIVFTYFPGARGVRAVARHALFLAFPMAIAFSFLIDRAAARISVMHSITTRYALAAVLIVLAISSLAEQPGRTDSFSKKDELAYLNALAATLPDDCSAFYATAREDANPVTYESQIDAMMVSVMRQVPTLNGYSGQFPAGWNLWDVVDPDYEAHVRQWIDTHQIKGKICRIEVYPLIEQTDEVALFVRRQYLHVLGRQPDAEGLNGWVKVLRQCAPGDHSCDPAQVAATFFKSTEFLERNYFIYRLYETGLGRRPSYVEYVADVKRIGGFKTADDEAAGKIAFVNEFVLKPEFRARHEQSSSARYVDELLNTVGVTLAGRKQLVTALENGKMTRGEVLYEAVKSKEVFEKLYPRAYVVLHYFAYLRRDPDPEGLAGHLRHLEEANDFRQVTFDFIYAGEYLQRVTGGRRAAP